MGLSLLNPGPYRLSKKHWLLNPLAKPSIYMTRPKLVLNSTKLTFLLHLY